MKVLMIIAVMIVALLIVPSVSASVVGPNFSLTERDGNAVVSVLNTNENAVLEGNIVLMTGGEILYSSTFTIKGMEEYKDKVSIEKEGIYQATLFFTITNEYGEEQQGQVHLTNFFVPEEEKRNDSKISAGFFAGAFIGCLLLYCLFRKK